MSISINEIDERHLLEDEYCEPLNCSITDVVASVYCEQKAVFDKTIGDRSNDDIRSLKRQGILEHNKFEDESHADAAFKAQDQRCFIATQIYGPHAVETNQLRDWRDRVLRRTALGRIIIRIYYRVSPRMLPLIRSSRWLTTLVRRVLDSFIWFVR